MTDRDLMQRAMDAISLAMSSHDVMLTSDPPQDAWKARGVQTKLTEAFNRLRDRLEQPDREWVGLTDDEIKEIIGPWGPTPIKGYTRKLFDQIEAKLKEKNT
jgi:uncharacterized UPF0160 family protein